MVYHVKVFVTNMSDMILLFQNGGYLGRPAPGSCQKSYAGTGYLTNTSEAIKSTVTSKKMMALSDRCY